jgi:hypothetical protein
MNYTNFIKNCSPERIAKYEAITNNKNEKTILLYKANISVSQSFMSLICVLEVSLRNNIDEALKNHFNDNDWIINQKEGFMNHPSLSYIGKKTKKQVDNRYFRKQILIAEEKIKKKGYPLTAGRLIAEQTFGFWTFFFDNHQSKLLKGAPMKAFTKLPTDCSRKTICQMLSDIRNFRNRISHHEPICFNKGNIDFSYAREIHETIINILGFLDTNLPSFLKDIDYVNVTISRMEKKISKLR